MTAAVDKSDLIVLLRGVAREMKRLEQSELIDGEETCRVLEAARAVQLALVELDISSDDQPSSTNATGDDAAFGLMIIKLLLATVKGELLLRPRRELPRVA